MGGKSEEEIEDDGEDLQIDGDNLRPSAPFDPSEEERPAFLPPKDEPIPLPLDDNNVIEILRMVLDPKGLQKLQFTEVEVSWTRSLIKTDMVNYMYYVSLYATDDKYDWAALNKTLGYREVDDILLPLEVGQYSLARWQRAKGRKLIKDAHELAISSKEETDEAKLLRTGFRG